MNRVLLLLGTLVAIAVVSGGFGLALARPGSAPAAPAPAATVTEEGTYDYVATMSNNSLYSSSRLGPGDGTLFSALVSWVNVTFTYQLTADVAINASSNAVLSVDLSSPAWSRHLAVVVNATGVHSGSAESMVLTYAVDVSAVRALAESIQAETGYFAPSYAVYLSPSVGTTLWLETWSTRITFGPTFGLNFTGEQIVPTNLTSSLTQPLGPPGAAASASGGSSWLAWVAIAASLVSAAAALLVGARWYAQRSAGRALDLDRMLRPYREAIVTTENAPTGDSLVAVANWEDLVRVADTAGRPILRPAPIGPDGTPEPGLLFYVLVDATVYSYSFEGRAPTRLAVSPRASRPGTASPPTGVEPGAEGSRVGPGPDPSLAAFVRWAGRARARIEKLPRSSARRRESEALLLQAVDMARRRKLDGAWSSLRRALDRVASR